MFQLAFTVLQALKLHNQSHVTCILQFKLLELFKFNFSKFKLHFDSVNWHLQCCMLKN